MKQGRGAIGNFGDGRVLERQMYIVSVQYLYGVGGTYIHDLSVGGTN